MSDIDHPAHYTHGKIEVIDAIEDWKLGFNLGNVVKYVARAEHKGHELEDLKKARWYLDREIAKLEPPKPETDWATLQPIMRSSFTPAYEKFE